MTEEEYLKACGWERGAMSSGKEWWSSHGRRCAFAEAVDLQVAEDRARLAFVLARSDVTIIARERDADSPFAHTVDTDVVGIRLDPKEPR